MTIDYTEGIQERYGSEARHEEACLHAPGFDPFLLEAMPSEGVERDDGCGDPNRWIQPGKVVLVLSSGKNAFLCSRVVERIAFDSITLVGTKDDRPLTKTPCYG